MNNWTEDSDGIAGFFDAGARGGFEKAAKTAEKDRKEADPKILAMLRDVDNAATLIAEFCRSVPRNVDLTAR